MPGAPARHVSLPLHRYPRPVLAGAIPSSPSSDPAGGGRLMGVFPDFGGLDGIGDLKQVIGAALMIVLIVAVLMMIVSASIWAIAASTGNYAATEKGRAGVLIALGAAVLAGAGVAWVNFLINLGGSSNHPVHPSTAWSRPLLSSRGGRSHALGAAIPKTAAGRGLG